MKKMKTFVTSVVLALAISSFCHAQGQGKLSASSLLQGMGNVASNLSRRDAGLGKTRVAQRQPNPVATAALKEAAARDAQSRAVNQLLGQLQANVNANPGALLKNPMGTPSFSATAPAGDVSNLINRLNSMSATDVNKLMGQGHWLDQFTPYWLKNAGGNPLAQFGVPSGLMGALGTSDLSRILNPSELDRIAPQLRQTQILGNLAGGMAAEQNIRNQVQSDFYKQLSNKAAFDAKISKIPDEVLLESLLNYIRPLSNPSIH